MRKKYNYIFGPVPSRRLGLSLGVDIIPYKTCSFDCVYCESGQTTQLTLSREAYVPTQEVIAELKDYLSAEPKIDYITFSGAGEPLLNAEIKEIIHYIKLTFPMYQVAVLTNSSLFSNPEARQGLYEADLVIASLDAVSDAAVKKINRPHEALPSYDLTDGLIRLREEMKGQLWLEVFIVPGINDSDEELGHIKKAVERISPDKIQVNSLDRPGTEGWVKPLKKERFRDVVAFLKSGEEIGHATTNVAKRSASPQDEIENMLQRRPCTINDLEKSFNLTLNEIESCLEHLIKKGDVLSEDMPRGIFYRSKPK